MFCETLQLYVYSRGKVVMENDRGGFARWSVMVMVPVRFHLQPGIAEILGRTLLVLIHIGVVVRIVRLGRRRGIPERTVSSSRSRAPGGPAHGKVGRLF